MRTIKFSITPARGDRKHYVTEDDVKVVLSRLPAEAWKRLRTVYFNDRAWHRKILGYVTRGRRDVTICALPPRIRMLSKPARRSGASPEEYGAAPGIAWPELAVRRFLLYDTFLHEVGHLQLINPRTKSQLRFAREKRAQEFAARWRRELWSRWFDHPDPVHNPPSEEEREAVKSGICEIQK